MLMTISQSPKWHLHIASFVQPAVVNPRTLHDKDEQKKSFHSKSSNQQMFAILSWKMIKTRKYQQDYWQLISLDHLINLLLQLKCADNWTIPLIMLLFQSCELQFFCNLQNAETQILKIWLFKLRWPNDLCYRQMCRELLVSDPGWGRLSKFSRRSSVDI